MSILTFERQNDKLNSSFPKFAMVSVSDFDFYLKFTKPLVLNLPQHEDRVLAAAWVKRLIADNSSDNALSTQYLKLLLFVLQRKKLAPPFNKHPSVVAALEAFEENQTLVDVAKTIIEKDYLEKMDKKCKQSGDKPIYISDFSADLLEYVAVQHVANFGVQAYYAVSKEPLPHWHRVDKRVFPKAAKSLMEMNKLPPLLKDSQSTPTVSEKSAEKPAEAPEPAPEEEEPPPEAEAAPEAEETQVAPEAEQTEAAPEAEEAAPEAEEAAPREEEAPVEQEPAPLEPSPERPKTPRRSPFGEQPPSRPIGKITPVSEERMPPSWGTNLLDLEFLKREIGDLLQTTSPPSDAADTSMQLLWPSTPPDDLFASIAEDAGMEGFLQAQAPSPQYVTPPRRKTPTPQKTTPGKQKKGTPSPDFKGFTPDDDVGQYVANYNRMLGEIQEQYGKDLLRHVGDRLTEAEARTAAQAEKPRKAPTLTRQRRRIPKAHDAVVDLVESIHISPEAKAILRQTLPPKAERQIERLKTPPSAEKSPKRTPKRSKSPKMDPLTYATMKSPEGQKDPRLVSVFNQMVDSIKDDVIDLDAEPEVVPSSPEDSFEAYEAQIEQDMLKQGLDPHARERPLEELEWVSAPQYFAEEERLGLGPQPARKRREIEEEMFPLADDEDLACLDEDEFAVFSSEDINKEAEKVAERYQTYNKAVPAFSGVPVTSPRPAVAPTRASPPPPASPSPCPQPKARPRPCPVQLPKSPPPTAEELAPIPTTPTHYMTGVPPERYQFQYESPPQPDYLPMQKTQRPADLSPKRFIGEYVTPYKKQEVFDEDLPSGFASPGSPDLVCEEEEEDEDQIFGSAAPPFDDDDDDEEQWHQSQIFDDNIVDEECEWAPSTPPVQKFNAFDYAHMGGSMRVESPPRDIYGLPDNFSPDINLDQLKQDICEKAQRGKGDLREYGRSPDVVTPVEGVEHLTPERRQMYERTLNAQQCWPEKPQLPFPPRGTRPNLSPIGSPVDYPATPTTRQPCPPSAGREGPQRRQLRKELKKRRLDFDGDQAGACDVQIHVTEHDRDLPPTWADLQMSPGLIADIRRAQGIGASPPTPPQYDASPRTPRPLNLYEEQMPDVCLPSESPPSPMSQYGVLEGLVDQLKQHERQPVQRAKGFHRRQPGRKGERLTQAPADYRQRGKDFYERCPWRRLDQVQEQPIEERVEELHHEMEREAGAEMAAAARQRQQERGLIDEPVPEGLCSPLRPPTQVPFYSTPPHLKELPLRQPDPNVRRMHEMMFHNPNKYRDAFQRVNQSADVFLEEECAPPDFVQPAADPRVIADAQYASLMGTPPKRKRRAPPAKPQTMAEVMAQVAAMPLSPEFLRQRAAAEKAEQEAKCKLEAEKKAAKLRGPMAKKGAKPGAVEFEYKQTVTEKKPEPVKKKSATKLPRVAMLAAAKKAEQAKSKESVKSAKSDKSVSSQKSATSQTSDESVTTKKKKKKKYGDVPSKISTGRTAKKKAEPKVEVAALEDLGLSSQALDDADVDVGIPNVAAAVALQEAALESPDLDQLKAELEAHDYYDPDREFMRRSVKVKGKRKRLGMRMPRCAPVEEEKSPQRLPPRGSSPSGPSPRRGDPYLGEMRRAAEEFRRSQDCEQNAWEGDFENWAPQTMRDDASASVLQCVAPGALTEEEQEALQEASVLGGSSPLADREKGFRWMQPSQYSGQWPWQCE